MPELPEVEQVARELRAAVAGRRIQRLIHAHPDVLSYGQGLGESSFRGVRLQSISRRGKLLLLELGSRLVLTLHLRMTGRIFVEAAENERPDHCHLVWRLEGGEELRFADSRRFGRAQLLTRPELERDSFLSRLGPEPFDLTLDELMAKLARRHGTLKGALLDQSLVAGLGNIYVDEILHLAKLHPILVASTLRPGEAGDLLGAMRTVLRAAISAGGSTIRDYRRPSGEFGSYQESHEVFGREGQECHRCGGSVVKTVVVGRGTYLCPGCQPRRRRRRPSKRRSASAAAGK